MDLTLTGSSSLVFLLKKLLGCFTVCAENRMNNKVYLIYANKQWRIKGSPPPPLSKGLDDRPPLISRSGRPSTPPAPYLKVWIRHWWAPTPRCSQNQKTSLLVTENYNTSNLKETILRRVQLSNKHCTWSVKITPKITVNQRIQEDVAG